MAARIPAGLLARLDELVSPVRAKLTKARWTDPQGQHLTLKFLGASPEDRLDAIGQTCAMVAASHEPSVLSLTTLGAFPSRSRVRVLWIGVEDTEGRLAAAATDLDRAFESLGFPSEGRDYTPHLTIARFRLPVPLKSGFPSIDTSGFESFDFDALALFRSHLAPGGARYEVLETFPLGSRR